ncbi:hypothetical protein C1Y08_20680 [Pseudomonas sp. FW306-02-F02-AA]|uniref:Prophage PssSM-02 n=1 Tax=Pseudomonas fluorescens TaxID=294 RepID=A0A0N7H0Y1_PSEFL|nr:MULTISPECIES: hypothetical protein [Pseudomonas]ALI04404.1 hypothetical protein AO353_26320 [Pseudomonas fluorescens]PMZ03881.1 hypothetical protein C1Y07_11775 [Pseudomonas sp. FW306-02-F02-AB]PMZ08246.1 hypothetical protein C1Y06_20115 [Pseudomonas sp. FW306-02-H06C]PMZ13986.1 hypothetical protein C1Y08_20680 [Pseudomonas sp. FW306-02-F02-AA]PMZ21505.1 hypothetical protein C1Y09_13775 [Pseudomonas sp. FW306-02-F08-AA]
MSTFEMNDAQVAGLAAAICATAEAMGQEMNPGTAAMMAEDLSVYPVPAVRVALKACRSEVKGKLAMADILSRVQLKDGRPGKDEAWSIALLAGDEIETVVMTTEIQQAMTAASPILRLGDKVGARMAFMSAYERLVAAARAEAVPTTWSVSLGFDPARRVMAIESAVRMQLITQQAGIQYLADLRIAPITADGQAIAGLLTGSTAQPSPHLREKLAEVRQIVDAAKARQDRQRLKKAQADRVDTYLRKRKVRVAIAAVQHKESF